MADNPPRILLVEDDYEVAALVHEHLFNTLGAEIITTASVAQTMAAVVDESPDLALVDILLPDGNGLDMLRVLAPDYPVLVMTAQPTTGRAVEALRLGAKDLLTKPFDLQRLTAVVQEQLTLSRRQHTARTRLDRQQRLIRKVLRERKSLQERIDLLCKDLVGAYHDLAAKVADSGY